MNSGRKYGLQLRGSQSAIAAKKPLPPPKKPSIFDEDDDDEDNVEQAIARQAAKNRALKEVELQHKAALEQDVTVFSYDEVYDDIKATSSNSRQREPEQTKPKYITKLLDKAKVRQQEQEIIYERKLLKERQREDHLYGDKEKYVTSAYKKKLAEQAKWLEEERLRELREQAEEVTNRGDLSDFYQKLFSKNVAFGATSGAAREGPQLAEQKSPEARQPSLSSDLDENSEHPKKSELEKTAIGESMAKLETKHPLVDEQKPESNADEQSRDGPEKDFAEEQHVSGKEEIKASVLEKDSALSQQPKPPMTDRRPSDDALAAARERYLARKKMRTT